MTEEIKLSNRLLRVASYLPKGANFADIGSDHAYLPCFVCQNDPTAHAIAGEVNVGPLSSAQETINKYKLNDYVEARLGDGLSVLQQNEVNQVVIAGMGGSLIRTILENGKDRLTSVNLIITQPNVDEKNVRNWFMENHFKIQEETILEENGHIYEIIVGKRVNDVSMLSEKEQLFGPKLLTQKNELFYKKWESERVKLNRVISQMQSAKIQDHVKISKFQEQLGWIEEVLEDVDHN
jgi:tRNA (adenine22-N1)-methyltransferase